MGQFLSAYSWDWWATLTWREEVGSFTAWNRTEEFIRHLEQGPPKRRVGAFIAIEKHRYRSDGYTLTYHAHLLIKGVDDLRRDAAWAFTFRRNGRARIEPFVQSRGASYYVAKYVGKEVVGIGEWDFWRPGVVRVIAPSLAGLDITALCRYTRRTVV